MSNSKIFRFRYLVALILLVILVAAVGNAANLTVNDPGQNVVEGSSNVYAGDTATVTYSIDNATGNVLATVSTTDAFDELSADFGAGSGYVSCVDAGGGVSWTCTLPNADVNASTSITIIAAADN